MSKMPEPVTIHIEGSVVSEEALLDRIHRYLALIKRACGAGMSPDEVARYVGMGGNAGIPALEAWLEEHE